MLYNASDISKQQWPVVVRLQFLDTHTLTLTDESSLLYINKIAQ